MRRSDVIITIKTRNTKCLPICTRILQTNYVGIICRLNGTPNRTIIEQGRSTTIGIIAQYRNLFASIGNNPLCIKDQILAKGGFLKGSSASIVEIPTRKVVVAHFGSRKGNFLANNAGNGSNDCSAIAKVCAGRQLSTQQIDRSNKVLTADSTNACIVDLVTESCNYAILYVSFESALCIRVNSVTDRTRVIFLVTRGKTGCRGCFCLCEIVGASKLICRSVFVACSVANGTFFMLNTSGCKGRRGINDPFIIVADCSGFAIGVGVATYATGVRGVTVSLTSRSSYDCIVAVLDSRNYAIRCGHFNSTVYIGEQLATGRTSVMCLVTRSGAGCVGCRYRCELMRTNIGKSNIDNNWMFTIICS